jgi:N-acetylmuramoyl-L-alanine amidase
MALDVDRGHRLPESEYFAESTAKSGIALHHTVCDSARTTLDIWSRDRDAAGAPRRVATAFVVDPDGTIYEAFDPACWAWQFGLSWRDRRVEFERRFIGIEITSEGGLTEHDGRIYAYDRIAPLFEVHKDDALELAAPYRGYRWFDRYVDDQLDAIARLVDDLCTRFAIPRVYPEQPFLYYGDALASFEGVIGHAMVRSDKSDPAPDPRLWQTLRDVAGLQPTPIAPSLLATTMPTPMTEVEAHALIQHNARRLDRMNVAAGSMVIELLMELARRDVLVKLDTPDPDGHAVGYTVAQGDAGEVTRLARALGFAKATDRQLEVAR